MKRCFLVLLLFVLAVAPTAAMADIVMEHTGCNAHCALLGGPYVFAEDGGDSIVVLNGSPYNPPPDTVIAQGCATLGYVNLTNTETTNVVLRAWVKVRPLSAPVTSILAFKWFLDDVEIARFDRSLTGYDAQGVELGTVYPNLSAGSHRLKITAGYAGSGQIQIDQVFQDAQGSPVRFGGATGGSPGSMVVDGTWRQITDTVSFSTSAETNLLVDGSFRYLSGTPGQWVSIGFQLDSAPSSQRTIDLGVPMRFPSSINVLDHFVQKPGYFSVPAGFHTISLWAINRAGTPTTIDSRQVRVIGFEAPLDLFGYDRYPMKETIQTTSVTVGVAGDGTIPLDPVFADCSGNWTTVMELSYPAVVQPGLQIVGEGYIEISGTTPSDQPQPIDVVVQVFYKPTRSYGCDSLGCGMKISGYLSSAEFGMVRQIVPAGRSQKFFWTMPLLWGTGEENAFRIVMRRLGCLMGTGSITVGKRWMSVKTIPTTGATTGQIP